MADETDHWLAALAGRGEADGITAELRRLVLEREAAQPDELGYQRLLRALQEEGLLRSRRREYWRLGLGLAASLTLSLMLVLQSGDQRFGETADNRFALSPSSQPQTPPAAEAAGQNLAKSSALQRESAPGLMASRQAAGGSRDAAEASVGPQREAAASFENLSVDDIVAPAADSVDIAPCAREPGGAIAMPGMPPAERAALIEALSAIAGPQLRVDRDGIALSGLTPLVIG